MNRFDNSTRWVADAPLLLVWCGDSRRIRRLAEWRGHAFANDHLDAFMNAAVDAGICMQTFIVAAESVGLGCCPISEIRDHIEPLSAELGVPIVMSRRFAEAAGTSRDVSSLGMYNLRGDGEPVEVFTLTEDLDENTPPSGDAGDGS